MMNELAICINCGSSVNPKAHYCPNCGLDLRENDGWD
ncbi:MAG: zinc-ribbon domain-containing protein [Bacillota bacterium]